MFRFTIRDVVLLTAIVALALGWWLDHLRMAEQRSILQARNDEIQSELAREVDRYERLWQDLNDPFQSRRSIVSPLLEDRRRSR